MKRNVLSVVVLLSAVTWMEAAEVKQVATGMRFLEGPVWNAANGRLLFSDLRGGRIYSLQPGGKPDVFIEPSFRANGNALTASGEMITCEHGDHAVVRRGMDGAREVLVDAYEGKALNSPNDVVVKKDGTIWFTDPDYGVGHRPKEQEHNHVFCFNPENKELRSVVADFDKPNGLCFSPDEKLLYIADSGSPHHIRVFDVSEDNRLSNGRIFVVISPGHPDGIKCDGKGNVWSSAGDGVHVFAPDGSLTKKIPVPETPSNLCFGGQEGQTLYITARTSLYSVDVGP